MTRRKFDKRYQLFITHALFIKLHFSFGMLKVVDKNNNEMHEI